MLDHVRVLPCKSVLEANEANDNLKHVSMLVGVVCDSGLKHKLLNLVHPLPLKVLELLYLCFFCHLFAK